MTRVYIRDDHLPDSDFLAAGQAYGGGPFGITENFFHTDIRADFAAMRPKMFSESERDPIHPAFDEIVSHVLQDRGKKPTELSTTGVIGRCAEEGGERPEQGLGRFGFESLVRRRTDPLHAKSIALHTHGGFREGRRRCRE